MIDGGEFDGAKAYKDSKAARECSAVLLVLALWIAVRRFRQSFRRETAGLASCKGVRFRLGAISACAIARAASGLRKRG